MQPPAFCRRRHGNRENFALLKKKPLIQAGVPAPKTTKPNRADPAAMGLKGVFHRVFHPDPLFHNRAGHAPSALLDTLPPAQVARPRIGAGA